MTQIQIILLCLAAMVMASPQYKAPIPIIAYENENSPDGSYSYGYESADGTKSEQRGSQRVVGTSADDIGTVVDGAVSYTGDDGKRYELTYISDENGYQPKGDFLPSKPDYLLRVFSRGLRAN
uniref:Uncharacterized protein n=1 Tax=Timema shepardi TaxID=629360 RepID=A0A7R9ALV7_TIMSH|nr:unnamed protein product [Timema shepardi]